MSLQQSWIFHPVSINFLNFVLILFQMNIWNSVGWGCYSKNPRGLRRNSQKLSCSTISHELNVFFLYFNGKLYFWGLQLTRYSIPIFVQRVIWHFQVRNKFDLILPYYESIEWGKSKQLRSNAIYLLVKYAHKKV